MFVDFVVVIRHPTSVFLLLLLLWRSQITCDDDGDDNDDRIATQNSIFLLSIELRRKHLKQRRANILWIIHITADSKSMTWQILLLRCRVCFLIIKSDIIRIGIEIFFAQYPFRRVKMLYILYNVIKLFDWPVCRQHSRFVTFKLNLQSTLIVAVNKEKEQLYLSVNWTSFLLPFDFREVGIINVKIFFPSLFICALVSKFLFSFSIAILWKRLSFYVARQWRSVGQMRLM